MMTQTRKTIRSWIYIIIFGILIGLYAVIPTTVSNDTGVLFLFLAVPVIFAMLALKDPYRIYVFMFMLVASLSLGARFRFDSGKIHQGGAEAALAPIDFPLIGLLLLGLAQLITNRKRIKFRITGFGVALFLFVTANIISVIVASDVSLALINLSRLIKMILLVLVILHFIRTERDFRLVIVLLFGIMVVQSILAIAQSFFNSSLGLGFLTGSIALISEEGSFAIERAGGTLGHPSVLGIFFEMTLPIALAIFFWSNWGKLKVMSLVALGFGLIGAFLTYSRASWGAVLLGLFVVILTAIFIQKRHNARYLRYSVIVLLGVLIIGFVFRDAIARRLELYNSNSWKFRLQTYEIAWDMIQAHPLFGVGANNYLEVIGDYSNVTGTEPGAQYPAHNVFLLLAAEIGIFGLSTFLFLLATIFSQTYRLLKTRVGLVVACSIGISAGIVAVLAHSMLSWALQLDPIYVLFWFNVGLLLTLRNWNGYKVDGSA